MEELKYKNKIEDVVSSYVRLKHQGRNLQGLCPFHAEKTPSFNVYPQSESFYCFGCGVGGDAITFVEMIENLGYIETIKFLADRVGMIVPDFDIPDKTFSKEFENKRRMYEINREAARYFYRCLCDKKTGNKGRRYLLSRGLDPLIIKKFGLGYAPDSSNGFIKYLLNLGFSEDEIVESNLGMKSYDYSGIRPRFFDRIMFPIIDLRGNVVAFGGRTLGDYKPKYLNTSETIVFNKGKNLYGLNFAKKHTSDDLILVEGYMDVISLHSAGFKNAVATLGTAITTEQISLMCRNKKEIFICYDSDEAGIKAAKRAINLIKKSAMFVKIINLPGAKDPDEYIRSNGDLGVEKFKNLLKTAMNDVEYRLEKEKETYDLSGLNGKLDYLKSGVKILAGVDDDFERKIYCDKLSKQVGIERSLIESYIKKEIKKSKFKTEREYVNKISFNIKSLKNETRKTKKTILEEILIGAAIMNPSHIEHNKTLDLEMFDDEFCKELFKIIIKTINEDEITPQNAKYVLKWSNFENILTEEKKAVLAKILAKEEEKQTTKEMFDEYVKSFVLLSQLKEVKKVILNSGGDTERETEKMKECIEILKQMKTS